MYNLKDLVEVFYTKQYTLLKCFALWELSEDTSPRIKFIYRMYFWYFLIFWMLLLDFSMIMQLATNIDNVDEIIKVLFMFGSAMAVMGKYLYIKMHNQHFEELFNSLHQDEFLPRNSQETKIFLTAVKLSGKVRNSYASLSIATLSGIFMSQFISKERELPVSIYIPMDLNTNFKYTLMYIYQCLSVAVLCFVNVGFDSLAASFFIYLKGQLDMLAYRLENIGRGGGVGRCGTMSQQGLLKQLKDCVVYYQRISELTHLMEDLISIPMSIQIACSVFVLIANFYAMSLLSEAGEIAKFLKFLLYQSCMLTQIFILCYFANEVSMKSSEISFNLYNSDWYEWNQINRKLVLLMMLRFESPIRIRSVNSCYSFNLAAFTSIVNSSYSYFALLKRINS